jgi:hypothetical protein
VYTQWVWGLLETYMTEDRPPWVQEY